MMQAQHSHLEVWEPAYVINTNQSKKGDNSCIQDETPKKDKVVPGKQHYGGTDGKPEGKLFK